MVDIAPIDFAPGEGGALDRDMDGGGTSKGGIGGARVLVIGVKALP